MRQVVAGPHRISSKAVAPTSPGGGHARMPVCIQPYLIVVGVDSSIAVTSLARKGARRGETTVAIHVVNSCRRSHVRKASKKPYTSSAKISRSASPILLFKTRCASDIVPFGGIRHVSQVLVEARRVRPDRRRTLRQQPVLFMSLLKATSISILTRTCICIFNSMQWWKIE
jgi:hypothetical protein